MVVYLLTILDEDEWRFRNSHIFSSLEKAQEFVTGRARYGLNWRTFGTVNWWVVDSGVLYDISRRIVDDSEGVDK